MQCPDHIEFDMLLIKCPWCGDRAQIEFSYGGDALVSRPNNPESAGTGVWFDYVYLRDNPRGVHTEYWQHIAGCRRWFKVRRDTLSHEILDVEHPKRVEDAENE